jgi:hypothetical protein
MCVLVCVCVCVSVCLSVSLSVTLSLSLSLSTSGNLRRAHPQNTTRVHTQKHYTCTHLADTVYARAHTRLSVYARLCVCVWEWGHDSHLACNMPPAAPHATHTNTHPHNHRPHQRPRLHRKTRPRQSPRRRTYYFVFIFNQFFVYFASQACESTRV